MEDGHAPTPVTVSPTRWERDHPDANKGAEHKHLMAPMKTHGDYWWVTHSTMHFTFSIWMRCIRDDDTNKKIKDVCVHYVLLLRDDLIKSE